MSDYMKTVGRVAQQVTGWVLVFALPAMLVGLGARCMWWMFMLGWNVIP